MNIDTLDPVERDGELVNRYEIHPSPDEYPFATVTVDTIPDRNKFTAQWYTEMSVVGFVDAVEDDIDGSDVYGQFTPTYPNPTDDTFVGTLEGVQSHQWYPTQYSYLEAPFKSHMGGVCWARTDPPEITITIENDVFTPISDVYHTTYWGTAHLSESLITDLEGAFRVLFQQDCHNPS